MCIWISHNNLELFSLILTIFPFLGTLLILEWFFRLSNADSDLDVGFPSYFKTLPRYSNFCTCLMFIYPISDSHFRLFDILRSILYFFLELIVKLFFYNFLPLCTGCTLVFLPSQDQQCVS